MVEKDDRELQKAELLWRYIEELKQTENPDEVQFVAVLMNLLGTQVDFEVGRGDDALLFRRRGAAQRRAQTSPKPRQRRAARTLCRCRPPAHPAG